MYWNQPKTKEILFSEEFPKEGWTRLFLPFNITSFFMSLFIASINSGSNGNCYYVGNQTEAILVDAGLSCRETEKRMRKLGLNLENVRGIFISHEHGDHIYGLETISKRYRIPVFTNFSTGREIGKKIAPGMLQRIDQGDCVEIDDLKIKAFSYQVGFLTKRWCNYLAIRTKSKKKPKF